MAGHKLTLDRPATYRIIVPGRLDITWSDWVEGLSITVSCVEKTPVTALKCTVDQAALQGLLRRLYALGLPLISVECIDCAPGDENDTRS